MDDAERVSNGVIELLIQWLGWKQFCRALVETNELVHWGVGTRNQGAAAVEKTCILKRWAITNQQRKTPRQVTTRRGVRFEVSLEPQGSSI